MTSYRIRQAQHTHASNPDTLKERKIERLKKKKKKEKRILKAVYYAI